MNRCLKKTCIVGEGYGGAERRAERAAHSAAASTNWRETAALGIGKLEPARDELVEPVELELAT